MGASAHQGPLRGWLALKRIYDFAERVAENRDDRWDVLRSRAISAVNLAPYAREDCAKELAAQSVQETRLRLASSHTLRIFFKRLGNVCGPARIRTICSHQLNFV